MLGSCSLRGAPVDAAPEPSDAPSDAPVDAPPPPPPIDAMRLPCSTAGLACGGTATVFTCGGNCWVRCTANVAQSTARTACAGWTGALGEIGDATEQGCVGPQVVGQTWMGLVQSNTATTTGTGWAWNGVTPLVYTNWQEGRPDDAGGGENGAEQCATIRVGGGWDDDGCGGSGHFLCERP